MSRSFIKAVFITLVVAAFANVSFAQDDANIIRPSTKSGSAAWIFEFGGLSTLGMNSVYIASVDQANDGSSNVFGAGFKTYIADELAIRGVLGFGMNSSGDKESSTGANSNTAIGVGVGVEMHTGPVYSTSPYFGAMIDFATSSHKRTFQPTGGTETSTTNSGTTFGLGVMAGFDWYFTRGIAVGGEYSLGFSTMSQSADSDPAPATTVDIPGSTFIGIGSGSVHLIVHF